MIQVLTISTLLIAAPSGALAQSATQDCGLSRTVRIGVAVEPRKGAGLLASAVVPETTAANAGLRAGDAILPVDSVAVNFPAQKSAAAQGSMGGSIASGSSTMLGRS
jgi:hypothetical protein